MHRPTIGAITVALFAIGLVLWVVEPSRESTLALACVRVGILMAVLWLAQPQLVTLPRWMMLVVVGTVAVVAWRPEGAAVRVAGADPAGRHASALGPQAGWPGGMNAGPSRRSSRRRFKPPSFQVAVVSSRSRFKSQSSRQTEAFSRSWL